MNISARAARIGSRKLRCARGPTWPRIISMRRIGAIFIAVCMVLIAASVGAVLYLGVQDRRRAPRRSWRSPR